MFLSIVFYFPSKYGCSDQKYSNFTSVKTETSLLWIDLPMRNCFFWTVWSIPSPPHSILLTFGDNRTDQDTMYFLHSLFAHTIQVSFSHQLFSGYLLFETFIQKKFTYTTICQIHPLSIASSVMGCTVSPSNSCAEGLSLRMWMYLEIGPLTR